MAFAITAQEALKRPKLFLDCRTRCHTTYLKSNINYVDWMLDRQSADIYMLLTSQRTGSGGKSYILLVEDKKYSETGTDTITFYTEPFSSDAVERSLIEKNVKKGLLPHLIKSGWGELLDYTVEIKEDDAVTDEKDPWDSWVFRLGLNGNYGSEASFSSISLRGNFSIQRITDKHKFTTYFNLNNSSSKFVVEDSISKQTFINKTQDIFANMTYVYSIDDHWSFGGLARYQNSIFRNYDHSLRIGPAVEYNVFPYSEIADKRLTLRYSVGGLYNDYQDSTLLLQTKEFLPRHELSLEFKRVKDWGDLYLNVFYNQFLNLKGKYSVNIEPRLDINIAKGLNFNAFLSYSIIRDRINIPKGDLSIEETLLRNKQLDSNYSFDVYFGLSYRFGALSNSIVNRRF